MFNLLCGNDNSGRWMDVSIILITNFQRLYDDHVTSIICTSVTVILVGKKKERKKKKTTEFIGSTYRFLVDRTCGDVFRSCGYCRVVQTSR